MKLKFFILSCLVITLFSCSDKTEELATDQLSDYIPLQPGKYITYRLDSLIFTNFGTLADTHRYQVKHQVDAQVVDNQGRVSWRVYTYIRDSAGTGSWTPNGTYLVTPLTTQVELTEDNFRVVKLHMPIKEGYQWRGNAYLPNDPYAAYYPFINDVDIQDWQFVYDTPQTDMSYQGNHYKDVITVLEADDRQNAPVTNVNVIGYNTQSVEKYSKSIGLVYRKYELWDYQVDPNKHYTGFGITQWMIDHN